jgi:hypothetical protein
VSLAGALQNHQRRTLARDVVAHRPVRLCFYSSSFVQFVPSLLIVSSLYFFFCASAFPNPVHPGFTCSSLLNFRKKVVSEIENGLRAGKQTVKYALNIQLLSGSSRSRPAEIGSYCIVSNRSRLGKNSIAKAAEKSKTGSSAAAALFLCPQSGPLRSTCHHQNCFPKYSRSKHRPLIIAKRNEHMHQMQSNYFKDNYNLLLTRQKRR